MSKNTLASALIELSGAADSVIVVHKAFVRFTGTLESAMMLSQLLYWTPKSTRDGWIAKSDKEFAEELFITIYAVRASRTKLEEMGILETDVHKFNGTPKVHYRLDLEKLETLWIQSSDSVSTQRPLCVDAESLTETTTETTVNNTAPQSKKPRTADEIRRLTIEALESGIEAHTKQPRLGEAGMFPVDVMEVVTTVCRLWMLSPPSPKDSRYAYWIKSARELKTACEEFGVSMLTELYDYWQDSGFNGTVSSPGSLINTIRSLVGKKRSFIINTATPAVTGYQWNGELSIEENKRLMSKLYGGGQDHETTIESGNT